MTVSPTSLLDLKTNRIAPVPSLTSIISAFPRRSARVPIIFSACEKLKRLLVGSSQARWPLKGLCSGATTFRLLKDVRNNFIRDKLFIIVNKALLRVTPREPLTESGFRFYTTACKTYLLISHQCNIYAKKLRTTSIEHVLYASDQYINIFHNQIH